MHCTFVSSYPSTRKLYKKAKACGVTLQCLLILQRPVFCSILQGFPVTGAELLPLGKHCICICILADYRVYTDTSICLLNFILFLNVTKIKQRLIETGKKYV
jgi:hypothetical protein